MGLFFLLIGSYGYSKEAYLAHGFPGPRNEQKIKKAVCKLLVWFGIFDFFSFLLISRHSVVVSNFGFLR